MSTGKIVLGVLTGLVTGVVLGMLIAPDKGSETRKKILEKGEDYADGIKDSFNSIIEEMAGKFESVKEEANHVAQNGHAKVSSMP